MFTFRGPRRTGPQGEEEGAIAAGEASRQLRVLRRVTYARTCEGSVRGERDVNAQMRRDLLGTAPTAAPREARCLAFVRTDGRTDGQRYTG